MQTLKNWSQDEKREMAALMEQLRAMRQVARGLEEGATKIYWRLLELDEQVADRLFGKP